MQQKVHDTMPIVWCVLWGAREDAFRAAHTTYSNEMAYALTRRRGAYYDAYLIASSTVARAARAAAWTTWKNDLATMKERKATRVANARTVYQRNIRACSL